MLDVVCLRPRLFMGALPRDGTLFGLPRIDTVISCLRVGDAFVAAAKRRGVKHFLIRPFSDDIQPPSPSELRTIEAAAEDVVRAVRLGEAVGVFCREGRNRSGIVVALALMGLDGMSAEEAIGLVRYKRNDEAVGRRALTNEFFTKALLRGEVATPS